MWKKFYRHKSVLCLLLCSIVLLCASIARAQTKGDTTKSKKTDTLRIAAKGDIETTIFYAAEDSIVSDVQREEIYLYGNAEVKYGRLTLRAAQIYINQRTQEVTARGVPDTTGRWRGKPIFKQESDEYVSDSMRYNFKTQKAVVMGIETKQGEGFVTGGKAKRLNSGEMYARSGRYTTCNLKHPHWYINAGKMKMIPEKQVVSGPFNLVISDIPTPLGLPFGVFPINDKRRSGIKIPIYGESQELGFFLREGGFVWNVNDYIKADILGEIYTGGSWGLQTRLSYLDRYRYSGTANIRFNRRLEGAPELGRNRAVSTEFWVSWSHQPKPRGRGSFSAQVNFGSQNFNRRFDFNPVNQLSNNFSSSISYNTSIPMGSTALTIGLNARQDQNSRTGVMNLSFPEFNLGVNRIYPFKQLGKGVPKFIKQINMGYTGNGLVRVTNQPAGNAFGFRITNDLPVRLDPNNNQPQAPDFYANFGALLNQAKIGFTHNIPISTTLKVLKYFSLNPSLNYRETWYPYRLDYAWQESQRGVKVDTLRGFARAASWSAAVSLTTNIYGFVNLAGRNKNRRIQAIRHTIRPDIALSYAPDFSAARFGYFQTVQVDSTGRVIPVSRFLGFEPAAPVTTRQSGVVSLTLSNIFEAKVKGKGDTAASRKINLIENLAFNTSYNLSADSLRLAPISMQARTRLFNKIDFNLSGTIDPYQYRVISRDPNTGSVQQRQIDRFAWQDGRGIGQLSNMNIALAFDITPKKFRQSTDNKLNNALGDKGSLAQPLSPQKQEAAQAQLNQIKANPDQYVDFEIPWSLKMNYNITYSKTGFAQANVVQTLNFNGDISLTKTWKMMFTSGYDITNSRPSFTTINIIKDLHCWQMSFNFVPFGALQSWSFDLNVKSSILQDLKLSRRRSWYDRNISSF